MQPRHLALVGPTATGKSKVAMQLARSGDVELVSVDSMQVYRGMDIGTAKPTATERAAVPHHLLDLEDPSERYTVARFRLAAQQALADIEARGHVAVLVGGTGLYLQAVIGDVSPPGEWPEIRARLEAEADVAGLPALYERLRGLDPLGASRMAPGNRRRIIRALEVTEGSGRPFSAYGPGIGTYPDEGRFVLTGLWLPRPVVAARITERVDAMMAAGFLDEVRTLRDRPGGIGPTARQALGYRELLAHLEAGVPLDAAVEEICRRTRSFSLRQRRWFRRDPRIAWYASSENSVALVPALLRELDRCRL